MGTFHVDCEIVNVRPPAKAVTVPGLLVDSESEFSWIPEIVLDQARIRIAKKDQSFVMANGLTTTRSTGYAILRAEGFEPVDEVGFGQQGDPSLLGVRSLVGLGATVDSHRRRLVAAGARQAAACE